jgi:hypothetical protein
MRLRRRIALIGLGSLGAVLLLYLSHALFASIFPRANFAHITGFHLPNGVRVVRFESRIYDNLFKSCYYWTLEAPPGVEFSGPPDSGIRSDFDNVDGYRSEALQILEPTTRPEDVPECYKFYRKNSGSQFLFRHKDGIRCYYVVSTL